MTDELRTSSLTAPRGWSMGSRAATETGGGRLEARLGWGSLGVEAYRHRWDVETQTAGMQYRPQASIPGAVNDAVGVFVEGTRDLGAAVSLVAGARLDHVSATAHPTKANIDLYDAYWGTRSVAWSDTLPSGKLRLEWDAPGGLELAATLGHTTRVAQGNERYFALRRMGTDWVGNPELAPARGSGLDLSATWRRRGALLSASAYANCVDGFIAIVARDRGTAVPGVMNQAARSWDNVDATLVGLEANAVVPLLGRAFLSADATWTRGRQDKGPLAGRIDPDLAEMPPLRARVALRYDDGRLFGAVQGVFSADQEHVDSTLGEERTAGWGVANVTLGYRRGRLSLAAGVFNVFDRLYTEHLSYQRDPFRTGVRVPSPGRSAFVNLTAGF
jgi:iron complex outermembrane receptor protein